MSESTPSPATVVSALLHPAVIVGALGYFVDIYDLILFGVVRVASLKDLGCVGDQIAAQGTWLINVQMAGMLIGGIVWGLLGDWRGRLNLLFGSIIIYSLSNIANGFVHTIDGYIACRFLAGFGLAGELGGGITLVSEILPQKLRGYGTMMISAVGVLGAVVAGTMGLRFDWRVMYFIGGGLGLVLLALRLLVHESGMYRNMSRTNQPTFASQLAKLAAPKRLGRYICCALIGLPCWYVIGLVILFSPEFGKALGTTGPIVAGPALAWSYAGISFGGVVSGVLSQFLHSRRATVLIFLIATLVVINVFFFLRAPAPALVYLLMFVIGTTQGYWAIFVTVAAEHFGTNLRATVATTVPNFARGFVIPVTLLYGWLKGHLGVLDAGLSVGWIAILLGFIGLIGLRETFHDELDYLED
jgi:predicted MFS family arabinose efflux permease